MTKGTQMGFDDANSVLSGNRSKSVSFTNKGDSITGILLDAEVAPVTNPQGVIQVDKNGNAKKQIIYTLQTEERDPTLEEDDGKRRLFAKWGIQKAISEFLAESGLAKEGLKEGGTLTVKYVSSEKSTTVGFNDIKIYEASYVPPGPRSLPTGTSESPWTKPGETSGQYSQQQLDTAWAIFQKDPNTDLGLIEAASKIPTSELEKMFAI